MAKYTVLQPVSYMLDGTAVHQTAREVGDAVELDDAQARPLVESGALALYNAALVDDFLPGPIVDQPTEADVNEGTARRPRGKSGDDESA